MVWCVRGSRVQGWGKRSCQSPRSDVEIDPASTRSVNEEMRKLLLLPLGNNQGWDQ